MSVVHKCSDCGFEAEGKDEHEAEVAFSNHTCGNEEPISPEIQDCMSSIQVVSWPAGFRDNKEATGAIYLKGSLVNSADKNLDAVKKVAIEMGKDMELRVHLVKSTGHIPIYLSKLYDPEES